jgi:predicted peptidase
MTFPVIHRVLRSFVAAAAVTLFSGCVSQPSLPSLTDAPGAQKPREFLATRTLESHFQCQVFLPADYRRDTTPSWPLLLFLHGAGERGNAIERVTVHGPPKIAPSQPGFPFVVVSPQCPEGRFWNVDELELLLDEVLRQYAIDPKRVYLTGLSMGGNGTWAWATAHPERFAAVAPICGWGDPVRVWLSEEPRKSGLIRLPIWAFHGAKDTVVPLADSQSMVAAFARLGNKVRLTTYPEAGHDSWTESYANPALYDWFLSHRLP